VDSVKGKPAVLFFADLASKEGLDDLRKLQGKAASWTGKGAAILGTLHHCEAGKAEALAAAEKFSFPLASETGEKVFDTFSEGESTHCVVLDADGKIVYTDGGFDEAAVEKVLEKALEGAAPPK